MKVNVVLQSEWQHWQFNGKHPWRDVVNWCKEHLGDDWFTNRHETIYFRTEQAYLLFLLRWS